MWATKAAPLLSFNFPHARIYGLALVRNCALFRFIDKPGFHFNILANLILLGQFARVFIKVLRLTPELARLFATSTIMVGIFVLFNLCYSIKRREIFLLTQKEISKRYGVS